MIITHDENNVRLDRFMSAARQQHQGNADKDAISHIDLIIGYA